MPQGQYPGNPHSCPPNVALPDDSDPLDASEINPGLENNGDRTAYVLLRTRGNPGQNWKIRKIPTFNDTLSVGVTWLGSSAQYEAITFNVAGTIYNGQTNADGAGAAEITRLPHGQGLIALQIPYKNLAANDGTGICILFKQPVNGTSAQTAIQLAATAIPSGGSGSTGSITLGGTGEGIDVVDTENYKYYVEWYSGLASTNSFAIYDGSAVIYYGLGEVSTFQTLNKDFQFAPAGTFGSPMWDPCYGQWLHVALDMLNYPCVLRSFDGNQWEYLGGKTQAIYRPISSTRTSSAAYGIAVRPSDGLVSIMGAVDIFRFNQSTLAWTTASQSSVAGPWVGCYFNNRFIMTNGSVAQTCTDGLTYTTAGTTFSPPVGFGSNPILVVGEGSTPTLYLFSRTTGYTSFMQSTDGLTWTSGAMLAGMTATETVVGACWDIAAQVTYAGVSGGLYFLLYDSSSGHSRLVNNLGVVQAVINHQCFGLASNNGELLTLGQVGTYVGHDTTVQPIWRGLQMMDVQDSTGSWQLTQMAIPYGDIAPYTFTSGTSATVAINTGSYTATTLSGYGGQFLICQPTARVGFLPYMGSLFYCASQVSGQNPTLNF